MAADREIQEFVGDGPFSYGHRAEDGVQALRKYSTRIMNSTSITDLSVGESNMAIMRLGRRVI